MLGASISRNALFLGIFAIISTAVISGTFLSTNDKIKANIRQAEERALIDIVPKTRHNNSMLDDFQLVDDETLLGLRETKKLYVAKQHNTPVAVILPATAREGYTGDIDLIVGINIDGTIAGVRVLSHRETPGLGDAIDKKKSDWVDGFNNKSIVNPDISRWKVKKDNGVFDQFTGATITPRAVTKTVLHALQYFQKNQQHILQQYSSDKQKHSKTTISPPKSNNTTMTNANNDKLNNIDISNTAPKEPLKEVIKHD